MALESGLLSGWGPSACEHSSLAWLPQLLTESLRPPLTTLFSVSFSLSFFALLTCLSLLLSSPPLSHLPSEEDEGQVATELVEGKWHGAFF